MAAACYMRLRAPSAGNEEEAKCMRSLAIAWTASREMI